MISAATVMSCHLSWTRRGCQNAPRADTSRKLRYELRTPRILVLSILRVDPADSISRGRQHFAATNFTPLVIPFGHCGDNKISMDSISASSEATICCQTCDVSHGLSLTARKRLTSPLLSWPIIATLRPLIVTTPAPSVAV